MEQREGLRRLTYRYDLIRGTFGGILEVGALSFGLLAAIRYFDAPDLVKGLLAGGIAFGLFLAPLAQRLAAASHQPVARIGAGCFFGAAAGYAVAAASSSLWLFVTAFLGANALLAQVPSLFVTVYARNYSHHDRGRLVANTFVLAALAGAVLSLGAGHYLDLHPESFGTIFLVMAVAALACGAAVSRIPSEPLEKAPKRQGGNYALMFEDPLFGKMLLAWMILGIANLALLPLRVEILANPAYGMNLSNGEVVFLTVVLFALARMVGLTLFGRIFERINFLSYRILINALLFAAIFFYFNFTSVWVLGLGSVFFGLGMGGGNLAWNLWVTRLAPDEKVSEYMSVHMGLTGVRGVAAPILAYSLLPVLSPQALSWISLALLAVSGAMFLKLKSDPEFRARFEGRSTTTLSK